ncbi:MAG: FG-GAP repeat domain-containing protein, partial [Candidatus Methylomirabilales bacterium]
MSRISRRTIIITLPLWVILTLSTGVARGDLDGDGNLDAVFANSLFARNRVCLGDGAMGFVFTCSDVSTDANNSFGVALGFVDGDASLDAVFANNGRNRVCLGDGAGGFTVPCSDVSTDANDSRGVALGFVDGDASLDAVFA